MLLCAPKNHLFMNNSVTCGRMKLKLGQSLCLRVVVRERCLAKKTERWNWQFKNGYVSGYWMRPRITYIIAFGVARNQLTGFFHSLNYIPLFDEQSTLFWFNTVIWNHVPCWSLCDLRLFLLDFIHHEITSEIYMLWTFSCWKRIFFEEESHFCCPEAACLLSHHLPELTWNI